MSQAFISTLPEELLLDIVHLLAIHEPRIVPAPHEEDEYRTATKDIHSLSLVDHQLRRLANPHLFAVFKRKDLDDLGKLSEAIQQGDISFHYLIQVLIVPDGRDGARKILTKLLPLLPSLTLLNLTMTQLDAALLVIINSHQSLKCVTTAAFPPLLPASTEEGPADVDMSKIVLTRLIGSATYASNDLPRDVSRGMRITNAFLRASITFEKTDLWFPGLQSLQIAVFNTIPASLGWLQTFIRRHTLIQRISIKNYSSLGHIHPGLPPGVLEKVMPIASKTTIRAIVLHRREGQSASGSETDFSEGWIIRNVAIQFNDQTSVFDGLHIIHASLPDITQLQLDQPIGGENGISSDEFIRLLESLFPQLETLRIINVGEMIGFDNRRPWVQDEQDGAVYSPSSDNNDNFQPKAAKPALSESAPNAGFKLDQQDARPAMRWLVTQLAVKLHRLNRVLLSAGGIVITTPEIGMEEIQTWKEGIWYGVQRRLLMHGGGVEIREQSLDPDVVVEAG